MSERRSLYHQYPDYRVELDPCDRRVRVRVGGELVADTTRALIVRETKHDPVTYVPLEDVRSDLIEATGHTTFCPFKGDARYWSVRTDAGVAENVIWGYPTPFDEVAGLAGYVAFYPDRVDLSLGDAVDADSPGVP